MDWLFCRILSLHLLGCGLLLLLPFSRTHVNNDRDLSQQIQDEEPDADALGTLGYWAAVLAHKLLGIQADFDPVVEQSQEWGQWESSDEDGDEAKLQHWGRTTRLLNSQVHNSPVE